MLPSKPPYNPINGLYITQEMTSSIGIAQSAARMLLVIYVSNC